MHLVLASQSPSRLRLLRLAGIEPEVIVSEVDEDGVAAATGFDGPAEYVQLLATAKARAVAERLSQTDDGLVAWTPADAGSAGGVLRPATGFAGGSTPAEPQNPDSAAEPDPSRGGETPGDAHARLVLGCDSAFVLDGEIHGKPHEPEIARERWRRMRGRSGTLHTGHTLIDLATGEERHAVASTELDFAEVSDAEVDWYVASGEPLEVAGAFTLDGLASAFITRIDGDPHAVVGLSLATLRRLVRELGHDWTALVGH